MQSKEREDAKVLFKTRQGKDQLKEIKRRAKTFTPGEGEDGAAAAGGGRPATNASGLTPEQVREGRVHAKMGQFVSDYYGILAPGSSRGS